MKIARIRKAGAARRQTCRDILRLARVDDLLSRAGAMMMRASPKATLWTAGIAVSGRLASYLGLPGFSRVEALLAPVVVGGGLLAIGAALRYVPRALSGRLTTVAEANDLNLMEDYRKSQALEHLNVLWDHVFRHESAIRFSDSERRVEADAIKRTRQQVEEAIRDWDDSLREALGVHSDEDVNEVASAILSERPLGDNLERSREGFLASALYALRHDLPQSSEAYQIGFRLNLYEDFCDGAYFDTSDTKLYEQYAGNASLLAIKREVGFGRMDGLRQLPRLVLSKSWFFLVTRKVAVEAGRAVQLLNCEYRSEAFNSQVVLWPGEEDAEWLARFDGARARVLDLRRSILTAALGRNYDDAVGVLERVFLPCFEFATELRVRYDPEYCEGSLGYKDPESGREIASSLVGDLEGQGYADRQVARSRTYAGRVAREQAAFGEYLSTRHPKIFADRVAARAARVAFHIDKNGLRRAFGTTDLPDRQMVIDREIRRAAEDQGTYSERLVALRVHHQLTLLQLENYKDLARRLAYGAEQAGGRSR